MGSSRRRLFLILTLIYLLSALHPSWDKGVAAQDDAGGDAGGGDAPAAADGGGGGDDGSAKDGGTDGDAKPDGAADGDAAAKDAGDAPKEGGDADAAKTGDDAAPAADGDKAPAAEGDDAKAGGDGNAGAKGGAKKAGGGATPPKANAGKGGKAAAGPATKSKKGSSKKGAKNENNDFKDLNGMALKAMKKGLTAKSIKAFTKKSKNEWRKEANAGFADPSSCMLPHLVGTHSPYAFTGFNGEIKKHTATDARMVCEIIEDARDEMIHHHHMHAHVLADMIMNMLYMSKYATLSQKVVEGKSITPKPHEIVEVAHELHSKHGKGNTERMFIEHLRSKVKKLVETLDEHKLHGVHAEHTLHKEEHRVLGIVFTALLTYIDDKQYEEGFRMDMDKERLREEEERLHFIRMMNAHYGLGMVGLKGGPSLIFDHHHGGSGRQNHQGQGGQDGDVKAADKKNAQGGKGGAAGDNQPGAKKGAAGTTPAKASKPAGKGAAKPKS